MSPVSDHDIITTLHAIVPEPPPVPGRLASVHHRAKVRRRRQVAVGSLAVVGAVTAAAIIIDTGRSAPAPVTPAAVAPATRDGMPTALFRPLHLPTVTAGEQCPVTESRTYPAGGGFSDAFQGMGTGPVALVADSPITINFTHPSNDLYLGTGWSGMKVYWRISADYRGPVLIRGAQIDGVGELRFDHYLDAVNAVTGPDGSPDPTAYPNLGYPEQAGINYARTYPSGIRAKAPGCYGIQVDGTNFSDVITFKVASAG